MSKDEFRKKIIQAIIVMLVANILLFGGGRIIDVMINKQKIEANQKEIKRVETDYKERMSTVEDKVEVMRKEWREDQKEILRKIDQLRINE